MEQHLQTLQTEFNNYDSESDPDYIPPDKNSSTESSEYDTFSEESNIEEDLEKEIASLMEEDQQFNTEKNNPDQNNENPDDEVKCYFFR